MKGPISVLVVLKEHDFCNKKWPLSKHRRLCKVFAPARFSGLLGKEFILGFHNQEAFSIYRYIYIHISMS